MKVTGNAGGVSGDPILVPASVERASIDPRKEVDPDALAVNRVNRARCVMTSLTAVVSDKSSSVTLAIEVYLSCCVPGVIVQDRPADIAEGTGAVEASLSGSETGLGVDAALVQEIVNRDKTSLKNLPNIPSSFSG